MALSNYNPLAPFAGIATNFGGLRDLINYQVAKARGATEKQALTEGDPGIGAPRLGNVNTQTAYGVALPEERLRSALGDDPANWRTARAQITVGDQSVAVPIVDVGPGKKPQAKGVVVDLSDPLAKGLGDVDWSKSNVQILPNAGPDYTTDRTAWDNEQAAIGKSFPQGGTIGAEPNPVPLQTPTQSILSLLGYDEDQKQPPNILQAIRSL